jgi:hypothetical protein
VRAHRRAIVVVGLSIPLFCAWAFLGPLIALAFRAVGVVEPHPEDVQWGAPERAAFVGLFLFATMALALARAFLSTSQRPIAVRLPVHGGLVPAECISVTLVAGAVGADEYLASNLGAGAAVLVTCLIAVRWWRAAPPAEPTLAPQPSRPAPGYFRGAEPAPGHVWFADVPFDDGSGSKDRPCLVVRTFADHAEVLKITSADKANRPEYVAMPTGSWDPDAEHESWLEAYPLRKLPYPALRRPIGLCDMRVWTQITRLHRIASPVA